MADRETFTERFNRLTSGITDTKVGAILGVTEGAVRKIRRGDTQTIELHRAIRLCRELGVSPYYLAGEPEPLPIQQLIRDGDYPYRESLVEDVSGTINDRMLYMETVLRSVTTDFPVARGEARPQIPGRLERVEAKAAEIGTAQNAALAIAQVLQSLVAELPIPEDLRSSAQARLAAIAGGPS